MFPRFAFVDVAVGSVLKQGIEDGVQRAVLSYDSACGYSVNFHARLADYEPPLITRAEFERIVVQPLIPKFHLASHKAECSDRYSFNYTANVGRMSGELVETPWAAFNSLQYSAREMGFGTRRDVLTDQFSFWNWSKTTRMCTSTSHRTDPGSGLTILDRQRPTCGIPILQVSRRRRGPLGDWLS